MWILTRRFPVHSGTLQGRRIVEGATPAVQPIRRAGRSNEDATFERPVDSGPSSNDCNESTTTSGGNGYRYDLYDVRVSAPELFTVEISGLGDSYLALYCDRFDPSNPLDNLLIADDDDGAGLNAAIVAGVGGTLQPDRSYVLVATTFSEGSTGAYTVNATSATAEVVPFKSAEHFEEGFAGWSGTGLWNAEADGPLRRRGGALPGARPRPTTGEDDEASATSTRTGDQEGSLTSTSLFVVEAPTPPSWFGRTTRTRTTPAVRVRTVLVAHGHGVLNVEAGDWLRSQNGLVLRDVDLSAFAGKTCSSGSASTVWMTSATAVPVGSWTASASTRISPMRPRSASRRPRRRQRRATTPGTFTFTRSGDVFEPVDRRVRGFGNRDGGRGLRALRSGDLRRREVIGDTDVVATDDGVTEGDETVVVTLLGGADYDVAAPISATVTITDPQPDPEPVDPCSDLEAPEFSDVGRVTSTPRTSSASLRLATPTAGRTGWRRTSTGHDCPPPERRWPASSPGSLKTSAWSSLCGTG